ncbi:MAG: phage portal protein [Planctomycetota bacterium]
MSRATQDSSSPLIPSAVVDLLLAEHAAQTQPGLERLWRYYRNQATYSGGDTRPNASLNYTSRCTQAQGLPNRLLNQQRDQSLEIVIENDIAWRVHSLVDFMFGKPLVIQSLADDPNRRTAITRLLNETFRANGGDGFFQDLALLGSIYGYVDVLVRPGIGPQSNTRLEIIEAPRAVPMLSTEDYRQIDAYLIHHTQQTQEPGDRTFLDRFRRRTCNGVARKTIERTEVWTADGFEVYYSSRALTGKRRSRVEAGGNRLGRVPVIHIQNLAQPFFYPGLSDVEALIPLQDELNTRLSDRANRVTFQSFKMYLGKGIDGFTDRPVGPGQMWSTDNPDAAIHEFGGDASTPSEDQHIREIREAMDKASGVSPIAAGVVGGKTGNLSSENAIRIVLLGLLARIEKKRLTYGAGIEQICELILHTADVTGVLPNSPDERRVRLDWPTPFPDSEAQQLRNALTKKELGVPSEQLLAELGYSECIGH